MRGEDGVVTIVERQLDFKGAIVLQFGRAIARDLIAFVEATPSEKNDSSAVFDFGGGFDGTDGKFCPAVTTHPEIGWPRKIEIVAIPRSALTIRHWPRSSQVAGLITAPMRSA